MLYMTVKIQPQFRFCGGSLECSGATQSDTGLALGAAAGYDFGTFRLEGEIAYQKNDLNKGRLDDGTTLKFSGDISTLAFLVNGYYDFVNKSAFTPFITAGIGFARISWDASADVIDGVPDGNDEGPRPAVRQVSGNTGLSDDDTVFAYQVGAGVAYAVTDRVSIDLKYRYFGTSDPKFGDVKAQCSSNNIYLGVRYNF